MNSILEQVKATLEKQGIDFSKEIIEFPSSACNQVICQGDHPLCGYSIRDCLKIWEHETGQKFTETRDDYEDLGG